MYEFVINRNYKKVRFGQDQIGEFVSVIDGDGFDNIPYQGTITEVEAEEMINSGDANFAAFWGTPYFIHTENSGSSPVHTSSDNTLVALRATKGVYIVFSGDKPKMAPRSWVFSQSLLSR